jgi:WD40 repeat protein
MAPRTTTIAGLLLIGAIGVAKGQVPQFVDTVWVRTTHELGLFDLRGVAVGNGSRSMVVIDMGPRPSDPARIVEIDMVRGATMSRVSTQHNAPVTHVLMADSAAIVCTIDATHTIEVWDWQRRVRLRTINDRSVQWRPRPALSPDGRYVFNASTGSMIDVMTGSVIWSVPPTVARASPQFSADGRYLIAALGLFVNYAAVIDASTGTILERFGDPRTTWISACAISRDLRYAAIVYGGDPTSPGAITIFDRARQVTTMDTTHRSSHLGSIHFMPDGRGFVVDRWPLSPWMISHAFYLGMWTVLTSTPYGGPHITPDWQWSYGSTEQKVWLTSMRHVPGATQFALLAGALTVYPNPCTAGVTVTGVGRESALYDVRVYDARGSHVRSLHAVSVAGTMRLDLSALFHGMYLLKIDGTDGSSYSTFVIKEAP